VVPVAVELIALQTNLCEFSVFDHGLEVIAQERAPRLEKAADADG
jgi:hypothetical protein